MILLLQNLLGLSEYRPDSHKPQGGRKTFKMNRRKELKFSAKRRAKQ